MSTIHLVTQYTDITLLSISSSDIARLLLKGGIILTISKAANMPQCGVRLWAQFVGISWDGARLGIQMFLTLNP